MPKPAAPGAAPPAGDDPVAWLAGIDNLDAGRGLRQCGNRAEMYRYLLGRFVQLYGQGASPLTESVASGDWHGLREAVHSLRGASATIGASRVHQLASQLEQRCSTLDASEPTGRGALLADAEELQQAVLALAAQLRARLAGA